MIGFVLAVAQSIDPFRQCALAHCHLPRRALRALGTAVLVAACGSIVFDTTGAGFLMQFVVAAYQAAMKPFLYESVAGAATATMLTTTD